MCGGSCLKGTISFLLARRRRNRVEGFMRAVSAHARANKPPLGEPLPARSIRAKMAGRDGSHAGSIDADRSSSCFRGTDMSRTRILAIAHRAAGRRGCCFHRPARHRCHENRRRTQAGPHGLLQAQGRLGRQSGQARRLLQALALRGTTALNTSRPAAWRATSTRNSTTATSTSRCNLVFADKEAHDKYQESDRHKKFIEENLESIEKVRVFDSYLSPAPAGEGRVEAK